MLYGCDFKVFAESKKHLETVMDTTKQLDSSEQNS